jgi:hypothetical protein
MKHVAALLAVLLAAPVLADDEEATLAVEGGPAFFRGTTPVYSSATTSRPGGGGSIRLTYGISDLLATDLSFGTGIAQAFEYEDQDTEFGDGTIHHDLRAVRAMAGATLRFGARWIPTASLALGYQHRFLTGGSVITPERVQVGTFASESQSDILVLAGVGLDYRLGRHLVVGVGAQLAHAFSLGGGSFDAIEIPIRFSYSWYPGWFRRQHTERLDD